MEAERMIFFSIFELFVYWWAWFDLLVRASHENKINVPFSSKRNKKNFVSMDNGENDL